MVFPFISQPSRQLPDNRQAVNYLFVRILRWKTRQSDNFFEKFLFLLKISMYVHLLLISVTENQYYFYPPIIFPPAMSSFGTHNLYLCRRDTKQHHHDNKTHVTQDTHQSDKTLLSLYHDSNHKRMLLRNRTWQRMATSRHHVLPLPQDRCRHHSPHPLPCQYDSQWLRLHQWQNETHHAATRVPEARKRGADQDFSMERWGLSETFTTFANGRATTALGTKSWSWQPRKWRKKSCGREQANKGVPI